MVVRKLSAFPGRWWSVAALLVASLVMAACAGGRGGADQTADQTVVRLNHQGIDRSFVVHTPSGFDTSRRWPAVLVFHGGMGSGERLAGTVGMSEAADREGFLAVYPSSETDQWNDGRAATSSPVDDVGFVLAVLDKLERDFALDRNRVFAAGISNGGMFTQRLACEATGRFRAFGVVVANLPQDLSNRCNPAGRAPMVFFVGTEDPLMPFQGGQIGRGRFAGAGGSVLSSDRTLDFWARANGCGAASREALADSADDGTRVVRESFSGCNGALLLYEIQGGGHTWHGSDRRTRRYEGTASREIDTTRAMLGFFQRHGL